MSGPIKVGYVLPPAVEALKQGWLSTFQSAATVSGLLAAVEAQLLVFFKASDTFNAGTNEGHIQAVVGLTYAGLLLSISATIGALILTDEFTALPTRAARKSTDLEALQNTKFMGPITLLLKTHGLRSSVSLIIYHWLISLVAAAICTTIKLSIYVISQEAIALKVSVLCMGIFTVLPLLYLVVPCSGR
ncbi:hypothetical protein OF83DRAFT_1141015 [Amylostereum chailletii]|nr:hypothetical protein OF83DRAFT_1141015 [Amylostereum chailletii]